MAKIKTAKRDSEARYWVAVASLEHVENGKEMGIAQFCHGKLAPAKRVSKGDWIVYYSSKAAFGGSELCQKFTAIGQVEDDEPYQVEMARGFKPYRRDVRYLKAKSIEIRPILEELAFIKDKSRWGGVFRYGFLEIDRESFATISERMTGRDLTRRKT